MSYEIVYTKQFIKTEDEKIIPLVLIGSNNCYTVERDIRGRRYEKRERNWTAIYTNGRNKNIAILPDKLIEIAKSYTGGQYQEHFRMYNKWVDDKGLIRFIKNGIKNAKTIEEISSLNSYSVYLKAGFSIWYDTGKKYSDGSSICDNKYEQYNNIYNSKELSGFLKTAEDRIANKTDNEKIIYISLEFPGEKAIPYPKNKQIRVKKEKPEEFWTIIREDSAYLKRLTKNGARLSYYKTDAKVFPSEEKANEYIENYHLNIRFTSKYKYIAKFVSDKKQCVNL